MLFATSDTHFNHVNIIKYCGRPFTPDEEGAEKCKAFLIERYRETVGENDIVIFLGDLAMGGAMRIRDEMAALVPALPGRKIMIRGNHDGLEPGCDRKLGVSLVLAWLILGGMFFCPSPLEPREPGGSRLRSGRSSGRAGQQSFITGISMTRSLSTVTASRGSMSPLTTGPVTTVRLKCRAMRRRRRQRSFLTAP